MVECLMDFVILSSDPSHMLDCSFEQPTSGDYLLLKPQPSGKTCISQSTDSEYSKGIKKCSSFLEMCVFGRGRCPARYPTRVRVGVTPSHTSQTIELKTWSKDKKLLYRPKDTPEPEISMMHMHMPPLPRSPITPTPHRCYLTAAGHSIHRA
jgi:hypothetical protein